MALHGRDHGAATQTESELLSSAKTAAQAGRVRHARSLVGLLVRRSPNHEQAWLELARLYELKPVPDPQRVQDCLCQALRINPRNRAAQAKLRELGRQSGSEKAHSAARQAQTTAQASRRPVQSKALGARGLYLLAASTLVVLSTLAVLGWAIHDARPAPATLTPTLTPSPQATATPTATATPSISERVSLHIPQLQQAWASRNWAAAVDQLAHIAIIDGSYPGLQAAQCDTYLHWGQDLEQQCQVERAHDLYRRALSVCQDREDISLLKARAMLYLSGKWRYDHERWHQAAAVLQELYALQPDYAAGCQEPLADAGAETGQEPLALDVHTLLHNSLLASSQAHLEQNELDQALQAAERALALAPNDQQVIQLVNTIQLKLRPPPTPTPQPAPSTGKRIEIDISSQRMYVWQGDNLLYNWACSTGKAGSGTATGTFRVQSRIPEAWGGQWSLRMPYWLGIYWVGSIENGIHALPISADGTTLWSGYLGTPVSFGCIILSTENARTLYHWADIGTPVSIHY